MTASAQPGKPLFRADQVGSLLRPQELKNAFRDFHLGRLAPQAFKDIQDRCIREAVALQQEVGLHAVTDGEFRRGSWFLGFVEAVDGLTTKDALFDFHDAQGARATFQTAYVEAKLKRTRGITADEFLFVRDITLGTPKVTMPAPSLVHFFRGDETVNRAAYADMDEFWSDLVAVYRDEIRALAGLGCRYVQLDEVPCAMLCDPSVRAFASAKGMEPGALLRKYVWAINEVATSRPAGMHLALHLCRGNYKGRWMAEGGYEPVAEELFDTLAVDTLFLEYDSERAGGFEPLRFVREDKAVVLGLVSSKTPDLESVDQLTKRIEDAVRYIPLDRLGISPQCGFASSVGGNPLTIDDEKRKLARVVEVAGLVWG
jgi:5-methyltetrahydropteroyltriglutamate--homocysteine methyltransferase